MAGYCHETADIFRLTSGPRVEVLVDHGQSTYNRVLRLLILRKAALHHIHIHDSEANLVKSCFKHTCALPSPQSSSVPIPSSILSYPFPPVSPSRYEPCSTAP
ncbi:hypothetical protein CGRA01v4_09852 [Colletotrichum graminicola]|nr:hypothetical protein CGRA01v4_09852 [Colletotrichum graminicola]